MIFPEAAQSRNRCESDREHSSRDMRAEESSIGLECLGASGFGASMAQRRKPTRHARWPAGRLARGPQAPKFISELSL